MAPHKPTDHFVRERLEALGLSLLPEWDVLAFLYSHDTSLTSTAQIASLLGHKKAAVSAALDRLESLGLIERSRGSVGVRLYRIAVSIDQLRYSCLMELMSFTEHRDVRLLLIKHLSRGSQRKLVRNSGLHIA